MYLVVLSMMKKRNVPVTALTANAQHSLENSGDHRSRCMPVITETYCSKVAKGAFSLCLCAEHQRTPLLFTPPSFTHWVHNLSMVLGPMPVWWHSKMVETVCSDGERCKWCWFTLTHHHSSSCTITDGTLTQPTHIHLFRQVCMSVLSA